MIHKRDAIALLITVLFVMIISVAIGYGLMELNRASAVVKNEKNLYKSSMILEDIVNILQNSPLLGKLADKNSSAELYGFIAMTSTLPLEIADTKLILSIESARAKININSLQEAEREALFQSYLNKKMVGSNYLGLLKDCMMKNKAQNEYNNYNSAIFQRYPNLFRTYIASYKHLKLINDFYQQEYRDENIQNIPFKELFVYGEDTNSSIDLNYATAAVWELMLETSQERAEKLANEAGGYSCLEDLGLSDAEKENLSKFKTSFFEPYLRISIESIDANESVNMHFLYDIKAKRGYDFVLEI
jgi:hypothetical protein